MFLLLRRKRLRWFVLAAGVIVLAGLCGTALLNPILTRYVTGEKFRSAIGAETAKGLHFSSGEYNPIRRAGAFTAASTDSKAPVAGKRSAP